MNEFPKSPRLDKNEFHSFAEIPGFAYINGEKNPAITSFLETAKQTLKRRTKRNFWDQLKLVDSVEKVRANSATSNEAIARSYDQEYGNPHTPYGYASAILSQNGFELITGLPADSAPSLTVIDLGAGSDEFLRFCRDTLTIPSEQLYGSDVSEVSRDIVASDGFKAHLGRLEELHLPERAFNLAYLSYFIDYDTNQSKTFDATIDLIAPGGHIVIEGLFPVRPTEIVKKGISPDGTVTKGTSAEEDIRLVMEAFIKLGREKGRTVALQKVVKSHRFVQSHYGFHQLPSYFLTFAVSD